MPNVFGKKIDLHPRMRAIRQHVALVLAVERLIIGCFQHRCQRGRADVIAKDPLKLKMIEGRLDRAGAIDRSYHEVAQTLDGASTIRAPEFNALVHIFLGMSYVCEQSAAQFEMPFPDS